MLNLRKTTDAYNTYLSNCDLTNKYRLLSSQNIPVMDKIMLEVNLESLTSISNKNVTDSTIQMKGVFLLYMLTGVIPYINIGISSAKIKFENSYMEYRDPNWKKEIDFLIVEAVTYLKTREVDRFSSPSPRAKQAGKNPGRLLMHLNVSSRLTRNLSISLSENRSELLTKST